MQTKITFEGGMILPNTLYHENMHQWWGDNVSEASYEMTFFKEGLAEWMESYVFPARALKGQEFEQALKEVFRLPKVYNTIEAMLSQSRQIDIAS